MVALLSKLEGFGSSVAAKAWSILDGFFPPEKRAEFLARLKTFILKNPKVSAFLLTNVALTGGPLILFILFSISVFVFALIVALLVGLLAAVAFTLFAVGVALCIVLPLVFFTTLTATFLFLWGLGGYYIFKYFNKESAPGTKGDTIGDKLNSLTGNNLNFVMENAREGWVERQLGTPHEDWRKGASPHHGAPPPSVTNGTPKRSDSKSEDSATASGSDAHRRVDSPVSSARKAVNADARTSVPDGVSSGVNGAAKNIGTGEVVERAKTGPRKLNNVAGTIKGTAVGGIGGATGLA